MARSQSLFSENGPFGALSNKRGCAIETPANTNGARRASGLSRQASRRVHLKIAEAVIADACGEGRDEHQTIHLLFVPGIDQAFEVGAQSFDPDGIGIMDDEWFGAEFRQSSQGAAAGVEQFVAFIREDDLRSGSVREMLFELVRQGNGR